MINLEPSPTIRLQAVKMKCWFCLWHFCDNLNTGGVLEYVSSATRYFENIQLPLDKYFNGSCFHIMACYICYYYHPMWLDQNYHKKYWINSILSPFLIASLINELYLSYCYKVIPPTVLLPKHSTLNCLNKSLVMLMRSFFYSEVQFWVEC